MAAEAIAAAAGQLFNTVGQFAQARNTRLQGTLADKQGFQDTQSRLLQLRQQREAQRQQQIQEQAQTQRTMIITISAVLAVIVLATVIYFATKKN
jgi:hypothetical protein